MTVDTTAINRLMDRFDKHESVWLFAYGSLIYKVDFPYQARRAATLRHWQRRFWQGSHDHRGTPEFPGRVATLVAARGEVCHGVAYLITPEVFQQLDYREKNGYLRVAADMQLDNGASAEGLVYIAAPNNDAWLGPASERQIAEQIDASHGPSGHNRDYLLALARALRELSAHDAHVFTIEKYLRPENTRGLGNGALPE